MGNFVNLPARAFKEDGQSGTLVDIPQWALGVSIQNPSVRPFACKIHFDCRQKPRLTELSTGCLVITG